MSSELNELLDELSVRIEKLKIEYEKYFMGIEKLEPAAERKEIGKTVRRIQTVPTANTALKYRLNSLHQRFLSYQNYWNRILREIEAGTYKRDLARVERDLKRKGIDAKLVGARSKGELEAVLMEQLQKLDQKERAEASAPAGPPLLSGLAGSAAGPPLPPGMAVPPPVPGQAGPPPVPGRTPPPLPGQVSPPPLPGQAGPPPVPGQAGRSGPAAPPPVPGRTPPPPAPPPQASAQDDPDARMKRLYRAYIAAKRKVGESTDDITYDRLVSTLQKQVPKIQEKTGCRHVDFKIEIRDGKAILKAVPHS